MSHHLDSDLGRQDNRLDLTDQFVFHGQTGTAFVMDVNSSVAGPEAPPGFHPDMSFGPPDETRRRAERRA
jgi:hypothetical protein